MIKGYIDYDDTVPNEILSYACFILNQLLGVGVSFERLSVDNVKVIRRFDKPGNSYTIQLDCKKNRDMAFSKDLKIIEHNPHTEIVTYTDHYVRISLDNWKQHQLLSRIDELEQTVQEQSKLLNKMAMMLENIWMHPSMPGGEEQKIKALASYNNEN